MRRYIVFLLPLLLIVSACSSGKRAFEKGDYEKAIYNAVNRLRNSPDNKKAKETLKSAYPQMVDYYQDRINIAKRSSSPFRWENVMSDYATLNNVYDEIRRAPAALRALPNLRNFESEYNESTLRAAEARYALGLQSLERGRAGDREAAKEAYDHFERALGIRRGFKDSEMKSMEARDLATLHVLIEPIPMHSRTFALSNEFFENQLTEYIRSAQYSPFIRFYSAEEASVLKGSPDQRIRMMFDDFVVGQSFVEKSVVERLKENVKVGTVKISEDSTADVFGNVKAKVTCFKKQISSSGLLDVKILDGRSNAIISQQKFPGTFIWEDRWGYFSGDERAISDEDKRFVLKDMEAPNPPPQNLFIEFTRPIFDQVTGFMGGHYRNY